MGRKLDLSGLTDAEAEHVLKVVRRDMRLRKKEEERLSEMKQELAEEGTRCSLLSRQQRFNQHCCIRCCAPFTFLLNPRRRCPDCHYNVCRGCCTYSQWDKAWLCSACQKSRILQTQSLEWYYNNVKSRFKRFGSAKVLKTLYRKHIVERGALFDLPEISVHEGSNDNDGNVCGSDSAFYKQSEGHSMAETLTVALRVAEEAIEEAIAKAEEFSDSLEKQNEARYLRDHKEELIEELATTIVQKIIQRRKRSEMQTEYDFVWPQPQPLSQPGELASPSQPHAFSKGSHEQLRASYSHWRSRSAFSLSSDDSPERGPEGSEGAAAGFPEYASLKREAKASPLPSWKSVDRLENSRASSVLQSPDGNWLALHSSQLSLPSLLTKTKSLVFSALEKESGVASAYDEMGSESDGGGDDDDDGGWVSALREFRRKLSDETYYTDSQHDPERTYTRHGPAAAAVAPGPTTSPSSGQYTNTETLNSDSEASVRPRKPPPALLKQRALPNPHPRQNTFRPHPLHPDSLDVNFNPKVLGDSSEAEERSHDPVRRSRRRRKSKRESSTEQSRAGAQKQTQLVNPMNPVVQENSGFLLNALLKRALSEDQPAVVSMSTAPPEVSTSDAMTPEPEEADTVAPNSPALSAQVPLHSTLKQLVVCDNGDDERPERESAEQANGGDRERRKTQDDDDDDRAANGREPKRRSLWSENGGGRSLEEAEEETRGSARREEGGRWRGRQHRRELESDASGTGRSPSSSPAVTPSYLEGPLSGGQEGHMINVELQRELQFLSSLVQQKYSAASLCSITTEVLKVLNATEELIGEAAGESCTPSESPISSCSDTRRLGQSLTKMEENVYLAAGAVYGLEGALGDLEECARSISRSTTDTELAFLEEQMATAAAQVQQSELQVSNIEARISALKTAGLNVAVCNNFSKFKPKPKPQTLDSSRHQRRKLPAPPHQEKFESTQQLKVFRP